MNNSKPINDKKNVNRYDAVTTLSSGSLLRPKAVTSVPLKGRDDRSNKTPSGNKVSRLDTVVESRPPSLFVGKHTKCHGGVMPNSLITVPFLGDNLFLVSLNDEPYTPMKPIVEGMGLSWQPQQRKLSQNAERLGITIMVIPSGRGEQETVCMPVRKLPGWMMTIHPEKAKPEIRQRVIEYQNKCDDVLWEYWTQKRPSQQTQNELLPALMTEVQKTLDRFQPVRYNYPKQMLNQEYFNGGRNSVRLSSSQLVHPEFTSPTLHLLERLREEGNNVDACFTEMMAYRKSVTQAQQFYSELTKTCLEQQLDKL